MVKGDMIRRSPLVLVSCILALVAAVACSSPGGGSGGSEDDTFTIAGVLPLTGPFGPISAPLLQGMKAEAKLLNDKGGILGKQIVFDIKDSAGDPQQSVSAMRELLADPARIDAVLAELTGSLNSAVLPVVQQSKIVSVTAGSQAVVGGDPKNRPYNFSFVTSPDDQVAATVEAVKATSGVTKVGIIVPSDDSGKRIAQNMESQLTAAGVTLVGTEYLDPKSKDYSAQLQKLRAEGAEILTGDLKGTAIGVFAQGLQNLAWKVPVMGDLGWGSSPINELVPEGVRSQIQWVGAASVTRVGGSLTSEQQTFIQAIKDTGGDLTSLTSSAAGADMVLAMKYAFEKAGTIDQAAAVKALEGMKDDPASAKLAWRFFGGQGPRFSADAHDSSNIDPEIMFAVNQVGEPVDGTYAGKALA
jgi:branched-chain amino acid transport system substrate-binding protein